MAKSYAPSAIPSEIFTIVVHIFAVDTLYNSFPLTRATGRAYRVPQCAHGLTPKYAGHL